MSQAHRHTRAATAALLGLAAATTAHAAGDTWQQMTDYEDTPTTFNHSAEIFPPWEAPPADARNFTIPEVNNLPDLHGDIVDPQLVIYFAGNQYMMVPDLVAAFQKAHPEYKRILYVTLPPGILVQALEKYDGAFAIGNLRIAVKPDILTRGKGGMNALQKEKGWFSRLEDYAGNKLALMVARDNPRHVTGLADLADPSLRIAMPNPNWEGIATPIQKAYVKVGGDTLKTTVMDTKKADGSTYLTHIHHRQTPLRIMAGLADVGPVWVTEAKYQSDRHSDRIGMVEIPEAQNVHTTYTAGALKDAAHPEAAKAFMDFMMSQAGQAVITRYGFEPAPGKSDK